MNPLCYIDFYKTGHQAQYPTGISRVWSNWTSRTSRLVERQGTVHFGLQYFIKKYLLGDFQHLFFDQRRENVISEYRDILTQTLGTCPNLDHIGRLWDHQRLPLDIYTVPEGRFAPCGVPALVLVNTTPDTFWLPNYLETLLSNTLWQPSTSATIATIYREIFESAAREFGHTDLSFVDWQGHDFSMRGLGSVEAASASGMGHLLSFKGTDTIPAILTAHQYYHAALSCGGSVPATEHSVMCAGSLEGELETIKRLITEVYPTGIVSIVSDTWDLWRVLTDYLPALKDTILARDGKIVIRPDSGDPVNIVCGDPAATNPSECAGVLRLLRDTFGLDPSGMLNKVGVIYGDSITPDRARAITSRCVRELGMSPYNCVFGIGSYTYQYQTRDTLGFAMKATAIEQHGRVVPIYKDPVTDTGGKRSHKGIPLATHKYLGHDKFTLQCTTSITPANLDECAFRKVFSDGQLLIDENFDLVRQRVRENIYETH